MHQKSLALDTARCGADDPIIATSLGNIGNVYESMARYPEALEMQLRKVTRSFEKLALVQACV